MGFCSHFSIPFKQIIIPFPLPDPLRFESGAVEHDECVEDMRAEAGLVHVRMEGVTVRALLRPVGEVAAADHTGGSIALRFR